MNQHFTIEAPPMVAAPTAHGAVVEFEDVAKTYGDFEALRPTTLRIEAGEFFAIIGPSGSGKSTLLGITAGFVPPSAGAIRVAGADVVAIPPYRRNFGMVFQNYALFPHMSVAENIAFPLRMRGCPRAEIAARVSRMLAMVRLEALSERRPSQLSGGQQQRVALARAAVYDPLLLLMDEPLGALDKNLREEMQEEIKKFQSALGVTVIYVTHDQHEAAFIADRIAIMRGGRLEQVASPRGLYERPATPFVASFLGEASLLPVAALVWREGEEALVETAGGLRVRASAPPGHGEGSVLCIRPENIVLGPEARGLDNVFQGTVEDVVYTTGSVRYRVRLEASDLLLVVRIPSRPDIMLMPCGERVAVGWGRRDALLVAGETTP